MNQFEEFGLSSDQSLHLENSTAKIISKDPSSNRDKWYN